MCDGAIDFVKVITEVVKLRKQHSHCFTLSKPTPHCKAARLAWPAFVATYLVLGLVLGLVLVLVLALVLVLGHYLGPSGTTSGTI